MVPFESMFIACGRERRQELVDDNKTEAAEEQNYFQASNPVTENV